MVKNCTEVIVGENSEQETFVSENETIVLKRSGNLPFYFVQGRLTRATTKALETQLSFIVKGYEYSEQYQTGEWNGKECLLYTTRQNNLRYFPAGLLDRVRGILDDFGVDYSVEGPKGRELSQIDIDWISDKVLYPDQQEAFQVAISEEFGTICMPTGTGKTLVALALIDIFKTRTLIVVHRRELVKQWVDAIRETFDYEAGVVGSGKTDWKDITVAMVQTLYKKKEPLPHFDMLQIDEAHHCPARSAYKIAMKCNASIRFGFSATPKRADGAELKMFAAVGEIIYESRPEGAIKKGRIVQPEFRFVETSHPRFIHQGMPFHDVYTLGITANEDRNEKVVIQAKKLLLEGHTVYIHVEEIAHGKWMAGHIPGCVFVCGTDNKTFRDQSIKDFSNGTTKILCSTLLGEGVNIPSITAIIMAGGKKSETGCIQKIGRALRTLPGKTSAVVVDFKDKGVYLSDHWQERYATYKKFYGSYCP
jgi:superfamily II DNA or RNA helicase